MFTLNCRGRLVLIDKPLVMGIINVTPDSFYKGSRKQAAHDIIEEAGIMIGEGADILDIGGQSTRPGSKRITAAEEIERVVPAIEEIIQAYPHALISIDTYYAEVAAAAVQAGATLINDISSGNMDKDMISTVASLRTPYICMHMKGTPETMQQEANYEDVVKEILDFLIYKVYECHEAGINDVIIDPGFGFGKTIQQNMLILKQLSIFKMINCPILVGLSRKATVYKTLGTTPEEGLNGTTVLNTLALENGANILRVHDVKEAREAVTLWREYHNS